MSSLGPVEDPWAAVADRFLVGQSESVRGRVRTHVIDRHLAEFLPDPPAAIADVGGGGATQSLPLARRGYEVTLLDSSPAMLDRAREALAGEPPEVAARVRVVAGRGEDAVALLGAGRFDAVLCHGVIPYADDPAPLIAALAGLAAPGGIVSIVAKNQAALATVPALGGRWREALTALAATREVNRLGFDTRADTVDGLSALLEHAGVDPVAWYGVRLFVDLRPGDEPAGADFADVLAVELEASRRDPYRAMSRLFHLIGRKRTC